MPVFTSFFVLPALILLRNISIQLFSSSPESRLFCSETDFVLSWHTRCSNFLTSPQYYFWIIRLVFVLWSMFLQGWVVSNVGSGILFACFSTAECITTISFLFLWVISYDVIVVAKKVPVEKKNELSRGGACVRDESAMC